MEGNSGGLTLLDRFVQFLLFVAILLMEMSPCVRSHGGLISCLHEYCLEGMTSCALAEWITLEYGRAGVYGEKQRSCRFMSVEDNAEGEARGLVACVWFSQRMFCGKYALGMQLLLPPPRIREIDDV